ncbi:MAG: hypothetical protein GY926_00005 [bacterium]|nr:hypothetical protein [bacterium]
MSERDPHPSLVRLLKSDNCATALRLMGSGLAGTDATSLLLAAMAQRSADLSPADVLAQYRRDRFVAPAEVDPIKLSRLHLHALEHLKPNFEPVETAPLAPLGSHSVFSGVDQNNVVTTIRMTEVAADPTNQLALEAAVRRQAQLDVDARSMEQVSLCAVDRVVRAQVFEGLRSFAHFSLLGAVISGRSLAHHQFESGALEAVLVALSGFVTDVTDRPVRIQLSDFDGTFGAVLDAVADRVTTERVKCAVNNERQAGRGYYPNVCFKLSVDAGGEIVEVGDGGSVDWAAALLQNRKERLLIAGVSLERLALI